MTTMRFLVVGCAAISIAAAGCDVDDEVADETDKSDEVGEAQSAVCPLPATPPAADLVRTMSYYGYDAIGTAPSVYGYDPCDANTIAWTGALDEFRVEPRFAPSTSTECAATRVAYRFYKRVGSTWSLVTSGTNSGTWSGGSCVGLRETVYASSADEVRVYARVYTNYFGSETNKDIKTTAIGPIVP